MRALFLLALLFSCGSFATRTNAADKEDIAKELKSADSKVRLKAVEKAIGLGEDGSRLLCTALLDSSTKVATAALTGLEKVNPKLYKPVSTIALDANETNRLTGARDIAKMGAQGLPAISFLIARTKAEFDREASKDAGKTRRVPVSLHYLRVVGEVSGDDGEAVAFFKTVVVSQPPAARKDALDWLLNWAADREPRRKELVPLIKANIVDDVSGVPYIRAAGDFGSLSKALLPGLKQLKASSNGQVREAATKAVEQIEKP